MTNFNIDDHTPNVDYLYPFLPHASTPKIDTVNWRIGRTQGTTLAAGHRVSFGICLEAPIDSDHEGTMYEYAIAMRTNSQVASMATMPFFGQLEGSNAAPVKHIGRSSGSGNRNQACFTVLPANFEFSSNMYAKGTVLVKKDISTIDPLSNTEGNPIVIGVVLTNEDTSTLTLKDFDCHISGRKYDAPIEAFDPGL